MAAATLPNAVPSNIVTRLRNRRDLETTMNTLKQLISSKTGSRKKNKPRSLAKKVLPKKTTKHFENGSDDDGEYYPNNLKRNVQEKKTILKPRHKLKVVVAMNKRKRVTPHKGLEQSSNTCNQDKAQRDMNVHTAPCTTNVHTAPDLEIQTPPSSSNPNIYELISPPHKSLTQLTADDLIRMDEDSLSDEDLMEILTCPSPVWWEDPSINRGTVFLTSASEVQELKDTNKQTELKTYTNKKVTGVQKSVRQTKTVLVSHNKAKKIAKLENVLGHIKSLVRIDKTIKPSKDIDKHFEVKDKIDDTIEINRIAMGLSKKRISSSGSEISVNQDDLLRNLESIDIPIQKVNANVNDLDDVNEEMAVDESIAIDKSNIPNSVVKESPVNNKDDDVAISKKTNKSNVTYEQVTEHDNTSVFYKTKASDAHLNFNKESEPKKDEVFKSYVDNIIRKLKPQDDILDVRLVKEATNVTNEVKIWSKLENFKPHNFMPVHYENEVIDVEDELEFSIIQSSPHKHSDPLDTKDETILIDDESNDASDSTLIFNDAINLEAIEQFNDTTITAIDDDTPNTEVIEIAPKVMVPNVIHNLIKDDTIKIGKHLDVRLIQTSDAQKLTQPKSKGKKKLIVKKKDVFNIKKSYENSAEGVKTREDFESIQLSLSDENPVEATSTWHINNYLQYSEESNDRGIFRVLDTEDTADTILLLNDDVDVSLVSKPGSKKDKTTRKDNEIKNNDLSITLVNKAIECVTMRPMTLPTLKHQSTFESPKSVKSLTSDGVDYPEGTISDTNIQFLDEYGNEDDCVEITTHDTKDTDTNESREDFEPNYMIKEDLDIVEEEVNINEDLDREGTNIREDLDQNDINMIIKEDLDIVEEEIHLDEDLDDRGEEEGNFEEDLSETENSEHVNSNKGVHNIK